MRIAQYTSRDFGWAARCCPGFLKIMPIKSENDLSRL